VKLGVDELHQPQPARQLPNDREQDLGGDYFTRRADPD